MYKLIVFILLVIFIACNATSESNKQLPEPNSIKELGELLFNDSILSRGNQVSCASCHKSQFAFADNVALSFGVDSTVGDRNTPSAMNMTDRNFYFHDGRSETLEEQARGPIENPKEMDLPISEAVKRLNNHKQYKSFFIKLFGKPANADNLVEAIAAFEKTLETSNSPFDNYINDKDTTLFTDAAKRGLNVFKTKGKCFDCHFGPDFTGDEFRNIGLFNGKNLNDSGRFVITRKLDDIGKIKVSGLRNIEITKPYMHNGMFKTLREVLDYYNEPDKFVPDAINRDALLNKPLNLTEAELQDLEAFLKSLTDQRFKTL